MLPNLRNTTDFKGWWDSWGEKIYTSQGAFYSSRTLGKLHGCYVFKNMNFQIQQTKVNTLSSKP